MEPGWLTEPEAADGSQQAKAQAEKVEAPFVHS